MACLRTFPHFSFSRLIGLLGALGLLLLWSGCGKDSLRTTYNEEDEPAFQRARQLMREGRNEEAVKDFLRLIQHRAESPESHLEVANLYLNEFKDPLSAYYHYNRFLALRPDSENAGRVRGQLQVARREFIRTLPGNPLGGQLDRVELMDQIQYLARENEQLKQQVQALRAQLQSAQRPLIQEDLPRPQTVTPSQAAPVVSGSSAGGTFPAPQPAAPVAPSPAPVAQERRYEVVQGDTLSSISRRMYGHPNGWEKIFQANRDQLPTSNALKPGQVLRIPAE